MSTTGCHNDCHIKRGFEVRLIPARESSPRISGLKLRRRHDLFGAIRTSVRGAVKACHLIIQDASEFDFEIDGTFPKRRREDQCELLGRGVNFDG